MWSTPNNITCQIQSSLLLWSALGRELKAVAAGEDSNCGARPTVGPRIAECAPYDGNSPTRTRPTGTSCTPPSLSTRRAYRYPPSELVDSGIERKQSVAPSQLWQQTEHTARVLCNSITQIAGVVVEMTFCTIGAVLGVGYTT